MSGIEIAVFCTLSCLSGAALTLASCDPLRKMQYGGYRVREYFALLDGSDCLPLLLLAGIQCLGLYGGMALGNLYGIGAIAAASVYLASLGIFAAVRLKKKYKKPAVATKRFVRLCVAYAVLCAGLSMCVFALMYPFGYGYGVTFFAVMPLAAMALPALAALVTMPAEAAINGRFISRAKKRLASMPSLTRIGITGSYGKTSVKNILRDILSAKFRVCATPESFNTPLGITRTVNQNLHERDQIFLAEMGARYPHDIKKVARIAMPQIGVITGIGSQHLATFGSVEKLKATKYELIEALPSDGFAAFNGASEGAKELYDKCPVAKALTCSRDAKDVCAVTLGRAQSDCGGSRFELIIGGTGEKIDCKTTLLGAHNLINIALAASVALRLGMTPQEVGAAVTRIEQVPHRLQLLPSAPGMTVIDDSYNASVEGVKAALGVLEAFGEKGKKIIITPGIIEMGKEQYFANKDFGRLIASVCDYAIVTGGNATALTDGILDGGMQRDTLFFAPCLSDGVAMLTQIEGAKVVLFCNDLPT